MAFPDLGAIVKGMSVTLREMFTPNVTYQYPEVRRPVAPRFRGRHELKRHTNGLEKCIGCSLCAAACFASGELASASFSLCSFALWAFSAAM